MNSMVNLLLLLTRPGFPDGHSGIVDVLKTIFHVLPYPATIGQPPSFSGRNACSAGIAAFSLNKSQDSHVQDTVHSCQTATGCSTGMVSVRR